MRRFSFLLILAALLTRLPLGAQTADKPGLVTITSTDGKSFQATVLALGKETVKVKRSDGREFEVPLSRLSPETLAAVQKAAPKSPAAPEKKSAKPPVANPTNPDQIEIKLTVKHGEKVSAAFEQKGDAVTKVTVLKDPDDKSPHFDVNFGEGKKADDDIVVAIISQSYPRTVRYRCLARNKGSKTWYESRMIPAYPNFSDGNSWRGVEELVLFDFKFTDEKLPQ